MWTLFLDLLKDICLWLEGSRESVAERAGQSEQLAKDTNAELAVIVEECKAAAEAPVTNQQMIDLLKKGQLGLALFFIGSLASCANGASVYSPVCLPLRTFSDVDQINAASDLQRLPPDSPVWQMMSEYERLRAQSKACAAIGG